MCLYLQCSHSFTHLFCEQHNVKWTNTYALIFRFMCFSGWCFAMGPKMHMIIVYRAHRHHYHSMVGYGLWATERVRVMAKIQSISAILNCYVQPLPPVLSYRWKAKKAKKVMKGIVWLFDIFQIPRNVSMRSHSPIFLLLYVSFLIQNCGVILPTVQPYHETP